MNLQPRIDRARRLLAGVEKNYSPAALASSFGAEDMVVLDLIARDGLGIEIFTLDTGRLPKETHALIADVRKRYGLKIDVYQPWPDSVLGTGTSTPASCGGRRRRTRCSGSTRRSR